MDVFALVSAERLRLADALDELTAEEWDRPSRCDGWSAHVVAAHLNAPWAVSIPAMVGAIARSFSIHGGFDRVARGLAGQLDPRACVAGLREHADSHFTPPGYGPEAPLNDVLVHGADILVPLGRSVDPAPEALRTALVWLASGRARGIAPRGRVVGLSVDATDVDVVAGAGPDVIRGPALALCSALCGRRDALGSLDGPGVATLSARL